MDCLYSLYRQETVRHIYVGDRHESWVIKHIVPATATYLDFIAIVKSQYKDLPSTS